MAAWLTRANRLHIKVDERDALARVEIFVAHVATPNDRCLVIRGERLVVHTPVQPPKISEKAQGAPTPVHERIEKSRFDVRVRVQRSEGGVETDGAVVVEQQTHAHATVCGAPQRFKQQGARLVAIPDVVLDIEPALAGTGQ